MRKISIHTVLVGMLKWKRLLRRPRHRCEDNIKMDIRNIDFGDVD
jgi:hypothetical protein